MKERDELIRLVLALQASVLSSQKEEAALVICFARGTCSNR